MSQDIQEVLFRGEFPVYCYMYTLRPFRRMNSEKRDHGWMQRVHEKLVEEEKIQVSYPTLTRLLRAQGLGRDLPARCQQVPDEAGLEMQHDTTLYQVPVGGQAKRVIASLLYYWVLIDEVGYVEVEPAQVGLFFTLMQRRHKTKTTLITSNLGFSDWGSFLKSNHRTSALIDRLTETSHVINMKNCQTLRAKLKEEGEGGQE